MRRGRPPIGPDGRARIRRLYVGGRPIKEICTSCGVSTTTIYAHIGDLPRRGHVGGRHLTPKQVEQVMEMGQRGLGADLIARKIGCAPSSIYLRLIRAGIRSIRRPGKPVDYVRHGRPVRGFRPDEDGLIEALSADGLSLPEISKRYRERFGVDRHPNSIRMRLIYLAAREEGVAA